MDPRSNTRKLATLLEPKHVAPGDLDRAVEARPRSRPSASSSTWRDDAALDALPKDRFAELYEAAKDTLDTAKDARSNTGMLAALLRPPGKNARGTL